MQLGRMTEIVHHPDTCHLQFLKGGAGYISFVTVLCSIRVVQELPPSNDRTKLSSRAAVGETAVRGTGNEAEHAGELKT